MEDLVALLNDEFDVQIKDVKKLNTRKVAMLAFAHISMHERICARRWKIILYVSVSTLGIVATWAIPKFLDVFATLFTMAVAHGQ